MRTQTCSTEFKREAVEEFVRGEKRGAPIARERGIDYSTLRKWWLEYEEHGSQVWAKPTERSSSPEAKIAELERVIGQLTVENAS